MADTYRIRGETLTELANLTRALSGETGAKSPNEMSATLQNAYNFMMQSYQALADKGVDPTGVSPSMANLPGLIAGLGGGSGSGSAAQEKDVNFYDYDGTLLHAFTLDEAQNMSALPDGPTHDGLVFQGWNWSLDSVKSLTRKMNIGAMYTTDDGKTRIYIHLEDGRTSPVLGVCPKGTVTVDWGDGTEPDTLTGTSTSTVKWTNNHQYAEPGDYVISLTVTGEMSFRGTNDTNGAAYILRHSSGSDGRNNAYQNAVQKIEIGDSVTSFGSGAFRDCYSLSSITIPDSVTSIGTYVFFCCCSLSSITIPDSVTSIGSEAFRNCYSLSSITIPDSVTSIGSGAFRDCYSLSSITTIPDSVTSIGTYVFFRCCSMKYYDFSSHTSVPTLSHTNAFDGIPDDCEIRVPAALCDEWKSATNWSTYASNIVAV